MMSYLAVLQHLHLKLTMLFSSIHGVVITTLTATTIFGLNITVPLLIVIFFIWYLIDFGTGCLASFMEVKNGNIPTPKSGYFFESAKARESGVKLIGYLTVFLFVYMVDSIFFNKTFEIAYINNKNLTLTEIVICGGIAIEAYSAIVENLKTAGFDIISKITNMATNIWSVIKTVKGDGQSNQG